MGGLDFETQKALKTQKTLKSRSGDRRGGEEGTGFPIKAFGNDKVGAREWQSLDSVEMASVILWMMEFGITKETGLGEEKLAH